MTELKNKTAVVTGGGSGVGRAICKALAAKGMNIVALDLNLAGAEETVALCGGGLAIQTDITSEEAVQKAFFQTLEKFGSVDLLVNCAGVCIQHRLADVTLKEWNLVLATNINGTFLCSREAWKIMREQNSGHVVHIASQAGGWPGFNEVAYGTAKTAQLKFGLHMADEFRFENILRTNAGEPNGAWYTHVICPGAIDTPMNQQLGRKIPKEQLLQPEEVADLVCETLANPDKGWEFFQTLDPRTSREAAQPRGSDQRERQKPYRIGEIGMFKEWPQVIRIWQEK